MKYNNKKFHIITVILLIKDTAFTANTNNPLEQNIVKIVKNA